LIRYLLVILTLVAAVAFVLSIAVEAKWIGTSSPGHAPVVTTSATAAPHAAAPTSTPLSQTPTRASILAYYFADPNDVKVSSSGHVFVADTLNDRVVELGRTGTQFPSWGNHALHRASMKHPERVLPLSAGFLVIDKNNTRIARFSAAGTLISRWTVGGSLGAMTGPTDLALDPSGAVYLSDGNNDRIVRLSSTGHIGKSWSTKGFLASAQGGPNDPGFPAGMAIDRSGDVYVAYPNAGAIQKFSSEGVPIDKWQLLQRGAAASDVAVDSAGNVYVVDAGTAMVTKFAPTGPVLATWGGHNSGKVQLIHPTAVAVDGHGHVYVADAGNSKLGSFIKEWSSAGKFLRSYDFG
jgi:DNA-binding beta-propeller fold protein YncE